MIKCWEDLLKRLKGGKSVLVRDLSPAVHNCITHGEKKRLFVIQKNRVFLNK